MLSRHLIPFPDATRKPSAVFLRFCLRNLCCTRRHPWLWRRAATMFSCVATCDPARSHPRMSEHATKHRFLASSHLPRNLQQDEPSVPPTGGHGHSKRCFMCLICVMSVHDDTKAQDSNRLDRFVILLCGTGWHTRRTKMPVLYICKSWKVSPSRCMYVHAKIRRTCTYASY